MQTIVDRAENRGVKAGVQHAALAPVLGSAKRDALALWVQAVNAKGGFGTWCSDVAFEPAQIQDILDRHGQRADRAVA